MRSTARLHDDVQAWSFPNLPGRGDDVPVRVMDVPPRDDGRAWRRASDFYEALAAAAQGSGGVFARRDSRDYLEPVSLACLVQGLYHNARFRHELWILRDGDTLCLPKLPQTPAPLGARVDFAHAAVDPVYRSYLTGDLPLCHKGFQFLQGWSSLEEWGDLDRLLH